MHLVDSLNLIDVCQNYGGWNVPLQQIRQAHPNVFTDQRIRSLQENFEQFFKFKQWFLRTFVLNKYKNKKDKYNSLNEVMAEFISDIKFPAHFEDIYKFKDQLLTDLNED